jgi:ATP-dependent DNA helicase DinG
VRRLAAAAVAEIGARLPQAGTARAAVAALAHRFAAEAESGHVRWIDLSPQQARLVESPLDIREMLTEQRACRPRPGSSPRPRWATMSAVLVHIHHGLEDAGKLRVGSPFDYPATRGCGCPGRAFPAQRARAPGGRGRAGRRCASALGGRTFVLTTTLRVLPIVAAALHRRPRTGPDRAGAGQQPRRTLLQRFGNGQGQVLVGSHSFWEGIDMPGDALQCVLIDKLPFPPPNDPLVEARVKQLREQGRNPFDDYFVAEAAVSLKQGPGG